MACAVAVRDMAAAVNTVCGVGVLVMKKVDVTVGAQIVARAVATAGGRVPVDLPVAVGVGVDDGVAAEVGTSDGEGAVNSFNGSAVSVATPAPPTSVYHVYDRLGLNMLGPLTVTVMQTPNTTPKAKVITTTRLFICSGPPKLYWAS